VQLLSVKEKEELNNLIGLLLQYRVTYKQENNSDDSSAATDYKLDP
jgi:hypothetical protein